jgi:hypothetical protein
MIRRIGLAVLLLGLALAAPARAQAPPTGFDRARALASRVVGVVGRYSPGLPGKTGFGLIVGEDADPKGGTLLVIIAPDDLVRDPAAPGATFEPPRVSFSTAPDGGAPARLLSEHVAPEDGNLAVLTLPRPPSYTVPAAAMADGDALLPGAPGWLVGSSEGWTVDPIPGHFALQDRIGWLIFDGLEKTAPVLGGVVVGAGGVVGLVVAATADGRQSRVLPLTYAALRLRAWGHDWSLPLGGAASPAVAAPVAAPAVPVPSASSLQLSPMRIVQLLPAEAAARASWTPPGARLSPWRDAPARLFAAPRREAGQVGMLPAGRLLPPEIWSRGAYDVAGKLDGGAWFLVATAGQPLGYVSGNDVVEVWPVPPTTGQSGGKVVREWTASSGRAALLRDIGTAFEIETSAVCHQPMCGSVSVFTPVPPLPGAILPSFQVTPTDGTWHQDDVLPIRLLLPRRVVETDGVRLLACVGDAFTCAPETLYPPPAASQ